MNKFYIQLNEYNFCIGYTILQESYNNMIEVPFNLYPTNISYIGRKFDNENMCWLDEYDESLKIQDLIKTEEIEYISEQEYLQAEILANQKLQDKTLAAILLNQMEG